MPEGLTFNLLGRDVSASRSMRHLGDEAEATGSRFKKMGGVVAGALAGAGVATFLKDSISGWQDHERVLRQSQAVIKSTGGAAHITSGQMDDLSDKIERNTGVDGDAILEGENLLATFTNIRNEAGKGNDIFDQTTSIMADLSVAMGQSTKTSAVQLGKALNDPITGVSKLTKVGVTFTQSQRDQIKAMQDAGNIAGAQKVILAELSREFGGSAAAQETSSQKMQVAYHRLQDAVGEELTPIVEDLANVLTDDVIPAFTATVGWLRQNKDWLEWVGGSLAAGVLAWKAYKGAMALGAAYKAAQAGLAGVQLSLSGMSAKANTAGLAMSRMKASGALAAGGLAAGMAAVVVGGFQLSKAIDGDVTVIEDMKAAANSARQAQESWRDALVDSNGALTANIRLGIGKQLQDSGVADGAEKAGISLESLTSALTGSEPAFRDLEDRLRNGGSLTAKQTINLVFLREAYKKAKTNAQDLSTANKDNASAQQKQKSAVDKTTSAMKDQTSAADQLSKKIKELSGDKIGAAQAELRFKDGIAGATQQVKDNGTALDTNTKKGRSNREWLLDQISSVNDVAQAQLDAGRSTEAVTRKMHSNETALRRAAVAAGYNKDEVDALIKKYGQVPRSKSTRISAPGLAGVLADITALQNTVHDLGGASFTVGTTGGRTAHTNAQGVGFFRSGFSLVGERGPELVRLPRGSQVHPASQTRSLLGGGGGGGDTYIFNLPPTLATSSDVERAVGSALERYVGKGNKVRIARGIVG